MPAPQPRDLEQTSKSLLDWLHPRLPDATDLRVENLKGPEATGFSNDTVMLDLVFREDGQEQRRGLVVRIRPTFFQLFPEYDLHRQFRVMELLRDTPVPVPQMYWEEPGDDVLGAPFYVMEYVQGQVPTDNPPYHVGGWVAEASPEDREAIWWNALRVLTEIHKLDWRGLDFEFLAAPELGATPLDQEIRYYEQYLEWAARGKPQPTAQAALEWIHKNKPADEPTALAWGDARIGNMIFQQNQVRAVLDWEMVKLGSPSMDLGWWIFLDRHHSEGLEAPRLPGFPSYEQTVERYEEWSGFPAANLDFYQVFGGFRFAVIMIRLAQQHQEYGNLPADSDFETNNIVTRLLAKLLELPPPGDPGEGTWR